MVGSARCVWQQSWVLWSIVSALLVRGPIVNVRRVRVPSVSVLRVRVPNIMVPDREWPEFHCSECHRPEGGALLAKHERPHASPGGPAEHLGPPSPSLGEEGGPAHISHGGTCDPLTLETLLVGWGARACVCRGARGRCLGARCSPALPHPFPNPPPCNLEEFVPLVVLTVGGCGELWLCNFLRAWAVVKKSGGGTSGIRTSAVRSR